MNSDFYAIISQSEVMNHVLAISKELHLPNWYISAGFIRSTVWDSLHGYEERTPIVDIDLIYFDSEYVDEKIEKQFERTLKQKAPEYPWSVKNQARMHMINGVQPYHTTEEGIAHFPETVTAIGIRMQPNGQIQTAAPYGLDDLMSMKVRPTPPFQKDTKLLEIYLKRVKQKNWQEKWPRIEVEHPSIGKIHMNNTRTAYNK
ncbi:nucleotidyltransferase family protein [Alkalihalobacillus pseudalcaliphilus]|uniref:nucleotidyltransferase family protein n=1 Tax=Alkalihalobacillus pseudalcaliphilus TaxID=79884 RepID=UPI00064D7C58|nr:nucleotidyltransferase family protein [Alkalihalobacillus pseudalcaliphilus]KMK77022.1 hypothetical protein AB990_05555 [Alkalihalobacillus pseudalcaliphilus]